jgi:uncharacterized protein YjgD (DUF1641 family)
MSEATLSNQPPDEMERLTLAMREALTDSMVERLTVMGANGLELLDRMNEPGTRDAVHTLLDRLSEMHKVGALDTACDLLMLLHGAKSAMTDNMVERLFVFFEQMITTVGNEAMGELAENTRLALDEAADETKKAPPRGGLMAMISMLSQPETQQNLAFLLSFSEKLKKRSADAKF